MNQQPQQKNKSNNDKNQLPPSSTLSQEQNIHSDEALLRDSPHKQHTKRKGNLFELSGHQNV